MLQLRVGRKPPGRFVTAGCALLFMLFLSSLPRPADAYVRYDKGGGRAAPALNDLCLKAHDVNAVYLMISNQGPIGNNLETSNGAGFFPSNTSNNYVFGTGLWFGAKYDADGDGGLDKVFTQGYNPLAGDSEFREGNNDQDPGDPLACLFDSTEPSDLANWPEAFHEVLSTKVDTVIFEDPRTSKMDTAYYTVPATYGDPFVRSDQDLVTQYTTKGKQPVFGSFQMPLQVNQRSMAFKTGLAGQAIFFILDVTNWGDQVLTDAWAGYDNDMDVGVSYSDDLTSFIVNRITPEGDTIRVNMAYAWDSDFTESNFTGDPGFVGIAYLRSPGNPFDGIDNDGDGLVDESTSNGIDDNGDGVVDDPFEVDELGLVNYSKHCNPSPGVECQTLDPRTDDEGYDLLACNTEGSPTVCLESTQPADIRFMMSSGPFDWLPGQTQQIVLAMVFANAVGHPSSLDFVGDPPRPDPNDPALGELLQVKDVIQGVFDLNFLQATPPPAPNMTLIPGDGQVTILWDELSLLTPDRTYEEFVQLDSTYRQYDFEGFRVWRSRTGTFSRRGDVNDPDFPLTPEAKEENDLVDGFDLELLAQYDLADGITTDSLGVTCSDSVITQTGDVVYTKCDTFNLGTDTGLQFSYVDRGDPGAPLINGYRYFYSVTAYDYNSNKLPVARLSLDSGVSFPAENSVVPRSNASSFMDAFGRIEHVDTSGEVLDDTSSVFVSSSTGELDPPEVVHASNALVDFSFSPGIPEKISDDYYTLVLDDLSRLGDSSNRITYHLEDASGARLNAGSSTSFDLNYDGNDHDIGVVLFDPDDSTKVVFTSTQTFNVDASAFVSDLTSSLFGENASGVDITDSLGNVTTPAAAFLPAGYRASDIRMEWVEAGTDTLTLQVRDLDNLVDVPFGDGIVDSTSHVTEEEEGSNWAFLPVGGGALQPGGRYFLTSTPQPIADLWICGSRVTVAGMSRMPQVGDVWTLRQVAMTEKVEIDTTLIPPDSSVVDTTTTYFDAQRPPVPGMRYRIDTQSGGQDRGSIDLTKIRVVPNPYIATSEFELGPTQKRIEFINLPPECTIRIYTISGNLVNVLDHTSDEGGTEVYNLRTRYNLPLASGNYYYHVTTPGGQTYLSRFAVVQ